ncbi:hypothetical protein DHD32_14815 [Arenibacter sp. TNZ]|jgi:hypothetical protein|uniref:hypothetical protein n=1 Tax=Arenibacter TaxID=178469 RepID=UPI000CD43A1E|nr:MULTISPECIES: hypothetical protein [Arenibacter]MCM4172761.1 hypothetical protein [Arenibacter sp. TNZ]
MKTILVFKTSVTKKRDVRTLKPVLNRLITNNDYWNFDLEDCDNILRVETQVVQVDSVIRILKHHGFYCEELE